MAPNANAKSSFHPALVVNNIKNHVTITLGLDNDQYPLWVILFTNHAKSNRVLHHIVEPKGAATALMKQTDDELWETLDATVLQWIYSTVTTDLLETIVEEDATAMETWNRIRDIFQDNKNSRAVPLEQEFSHISMSDFSSATAYCQRLKSLADQLKNVGSPVSDTRLVLQMVSGLTEAYKNVGTIIRQRDPLPSFSRARSMLTLEEAGLAKEAATNSALYAHGGGDSGSTSTRSSSPNSNKGGRHKKKNSHNKGNKKQAQTTAATPGSSVSAPMATPQWPSGYGPWSWPASPWGYPPCPYPSGPWTRPYMPRAQAGVLGPRPAQAYVSTDGSIPCQTDIEAAMYMLGLTPPKPWHMDTGGTSHMTAHQGTLSSYVNSSINNGIIVENGQSIPISGYGQSHIPKPPPPPPLVLKNILHAPKLVKNLISVRKFTTDNSVSVEFDPFGFCVKDLRTGTHLMRCNSRGSLYPISAATKIELSPSTFAALAPSFWHARLGHPGEPILSSLKHNKLIDCNSHSITNICQSCSLGKLIRLPFANSITHTYKPFDILHCDLWTSPVPSSSKSLRASPVVIVIIC
ncbi:uncharacterized protein LOC141633931 [Silene latifolia]|uniref:uncharacterized protein LOC141633931 n=1 Tax=Silene latifolia TaxID=37657 RepID=UPI003D787D40